LEAAKTSILINALLADYGWKVEMEPRPHYKDAPVIRTEPPNRTNKKRRKNGPGKKGHTANGSSAVSPALATASSQGQLGEPV